MSAAPFASAPDPAGPAMSDAESAEREAEEEAAGAKLQVIPGSPCIGQTAKIVLTNGWCGVVPLFLVRERDPGGPQFSIMAGIPQQPVFVYELGEAQFVGGDRYELEFMLKADYGLSDNGVPRLVEPGKDHYFVGYATRFQRLVPCHP